MTETGGAATTMSDPEESKEYGSGGRLAANMQGKIVDPVTGQALPPGKQGELWLRGPNIMKGDAFTVILNSYCCVAYAIRHCLHLREAEMLHSYLLAKVMWLFSRAVPEGVRGVRRNRAQNFEGHMYCICICMYCLKKYILS